jgi:hypothetical protein
MCNIVLHEFTMFSILLMIKGEIEETEHRREEKKTHTQLINQKFIKQMPLVIFHLQEDISNNTTKSQLTLIPSVEDNGKFVTCRAENPSVNGLFLEKSWKLDVVCKYILFFLFCFFFV